MNLNLLTRDITPDEFMEFTGIDLNSELGGQDTPISFLNRIKIRMETYLDANYFKRIDLQYPKFSDYQKENYKLALIEQALYVFKNGDISVDSGYDPEHGVVASQDTLKALSLCNNAKEHLINCGLLTRKIVGSRHNLFPIWWY